MANRRARVLRIVLGALGVLLLAAVVAFLVWAWTPAGPDQASLAAALADERVEAIEQDGTWTLRPTDGAATSGIVFYPGARVEPAAYVPNWVPIVAESGVEVVIPRMPLNLAVFDRSRAEEVIDVASGIERWFVGGHSLGGAMASSWLGGTDDDRLAGLILWASFPTDGAGLDERPDLAALSVGGTRDGLSTPDDLRERRALLPPAAELVFVDGMNHAQFGQYGTQRGDRTPTIDDREAVAQLARITTDFLDAPPGPSPSPTTARSSDGPSWTTTSRRTSSCTGASTSPTSSRPTCSRPSAHPRSASVATSSAPPHPSTSVTSPS